MTTIPTVSNILRSEKDTHVCSYPNCRELRRGSLIAYGADGMTQELSFSTCLRHERQLSLALKLLDYDVHLVLEPNRS